MTVLLHVVPNSIDSNTLRGLDKSRLLEGFSRLVDEDRQNTATLVAYIGEIDRRKLYLEHAYPSMFAFCTERFHMSEAIAARRIRAGRTTCRFPCILEMIAQGELHLTAIHHLAAHLTEENRREVLRRAKYRSTREIEKLVAELAPQPDLPSLIRALPTKKASMPLSSRNAASPAVQRQPAVATSTDSKNKRRTRPVPLAPRRYKLQVTIGQETWDKLDELQALLSHQIPDGDPAKILDRALDALLTEAKKKKAALTNKPRATSHKNNQNRGIPARARREVFERDEGRCTFVHAGGHRCGSQWQVEFHHRIPYAQGGSHEPDNITLRCRAHNQYEAELDFGVEFMEARRTRARASP
jgi:5-methylcytosine-specific restriction endonuclease McrA